MIGGLLFSILFTVMPSFVDFGFLNPMGFSVPNANGVYEIPFIDRMGFVFIICILGMGIISLYETKKGVRTNGLDVDKSMFKLSPSFIVGMVIILAVLAAFYTVFW
jgi:SSS family solute:Na+ symporter